MDTLELAAFLRSRREGLRPEDAGLPSGPRRRTPGLRREEVAVLAHISTEYYVRLEQGRAPRPSGEVLAAIAGALQLTDAESDHLHALAGVAPTRSRPPDRDVRPSIRALIDRLPATAAIVLSAAYEVLAWNRLATALLEDFGAVPGRERNLARSAFLDVGEAPRLYGLSDVPAFRAQVARGLRAAVARHPSDPALAELVAELRAASPEFVRLWQQREVRPTTGLRKTFRHRTVGPITLDCDTLALAESGQHLVLYSAAPGTRDAESLALLEAWGSDTVGVRSLA